MFDALGLREWCDANKTDAPMSMAQLLAQTQGDDAAAETEGLPFPSLDVMHEACAAIGQTRDLTEGLEQGFLAIRGELKFVLDPVTQPLSWLLDGALFVFESAPWWLMIPALILVSWFVSKSRAVTAFVAIVLLFFSRWPPFVFVLAIDPYSYSATRQVNNIASRLSINNNP